MADNGNQGGCGKILLALSLGAVIGGGLALLTAKRTGPETRQQMRDKVDELRARMTEMTDEAEARVKKTVDEGRSLLEENADLIRAAIQAGKEAVEEEKNRQKKSA